MLSLFTFAALLSVVWGHFQLDWPPARGFNEDELVNYPCGGQNTVSSQRTSFPINGAPIQLAMFHIQAEVQVLIGYGNNPTGDSFTNVLVPTFQELGLGNFCLGDVRVPNGKAGMNATLLVTTNGDTGGGLYNCADITLTSTPLTSTQYAMHCMNNTNVQTRAISNGASINPNGTAVYGASSGSGTSSTGAATMPRATLGAVALGALGALGWL